MANLYRDMRFLTALLVCSVFLFVLSPAVLAATGRTSTSFTTTGSGGVNIYPYITSNTSFLVDFEADNFRNIEYILYNFNYNTRDAGGVRGIEGKLIPDNPKDYRFLNGKPYIRRQFTFGSCSKNICVYDKYPTSLKATITTKYKNIKSPVTKIYNINTLNK